MRKIAVDPKASKWSALFTASDSNSCSYVGLNLHACRLETLGNVDWQVKDEIVVSTSLSLNYLRSVADIPQNVGESMRLLDASCNHITTIQMPHSLVNLLILKLSHNFIQEIPENAFSSLGHLQDLNLAHNKISILNERSFCGLENSLESLTLRGNQLHIATGVKSLISLKTLDLGSNYIQDIIQLSCLSCVEILDLSNNRLADIEQTRQVLVSCCNLKDLKLSKNPISQERHYKLKFVDGLDILKFDNMQVSNVVRQKCHIAKTQADLEGLTESTTQYYMKWMEDEGKKKDNLILMLKRQQEEIENQYIEYCKRMEEDLSNSVNYIQQVSADPETFDVSYLATPQGRIEWQQALEQAEAVREKYLVDLSDRNNVDTSETFVGKLRYLSENQPQVWRLLKVKELESRDEDMTLSNDDALVSTQLLKSRARRRHDDLAQAAQQIKISPF